MVVSGKILLSDNSGTKEPVFVDKIPGDETCIISFTGGGITVKDRAKKHAKNIYDEILKGVADIPNYALVYEGASHDTIPIFRAQERIFFERNNSNFLPKDASMIYISAENINTVFRQRIIPLLMAHGANVFLTLKFVVDGDVKSFKDMLKNKLQSSIVNMNFSPDEIKEMQRHISEHVFSYSKYFNPKYLDSLFDGILLPRIIDDKGERLPLKTAMQRVRKINIFAHCYGAYIALSLEERMKNKMRELGYSPSEMKDILSQLLVVALNPGGPMGGSQTQFISFISGYDPTVVRADNWISEFVTEKRESELKEINNTLHPAVWSLKPGFLGNKNGNVFFVKQRFDLIDAKDGGKTVGYDEHNNMHYVSRKFTTDGKILARFAHNILVSGIRNSLAQNDNEFVPLPPLRQLFLDGKNDEKLTQTFEDMVQNGHDFMKDVYKYAIAKVRRKQVAASVSNNTSMIKKNHEDHIK